MPTAPSPLVALGEVTHFGMATLLPTAGGAIATAASRHGLRWLAVTAPGGKGFGSDGSLARSGPAVSVERMRNRVRKITCTFMGGYSAVSSRFPPKAAGALLRQAAIAISLGVVWNLAGVAAAAPEQAPAKASVVEILDGKELFIDEKQAHVGSTATSPQRLSTGASRGQIVFGKVAAGRLNRYTQLRLGQTCFLLRKGQILVSGPQDGCTNSYRLRHSKTNYIIAVSEDGSSEVTVLEGDVLLEQLRDGKPTGQGRESIRGGMRVSLASDGTVTVRQRLTQSEVQQIRQGPLFRDFRSVLPEQDKLDQFLARQYPVSTVPSSAGSSVQPLVSGINTVREAKGRAALHLLPSQLAENNANYARPILRDLLASGQCEHEPDAFFAFERQMMRANSPLIPTSEIIACPHQPNGWDQVLSAFLARKDHYDLLLNRPMASHIDCVVEMTGGRRVVMCTLWSPAR